MPTHSSTSSDTILLNIMEQLGGINAKLAAGEQRHAEFKTAIEKIDARTDKIETTLEVDLKPVVASVQDLREDVGALKLFKGKIGAVVAMASIIGAAAISLLWEGLKFIANYLAHYLTSPPMH